MNRQAEYQARPEAKSGALRVISRKPCSAFPIPSALIFSNSVRAVRYASAISGATGRSASWGGITALAGLKAVATHPAIARATSRWVASTADMSQS